MDNEDADLNVRMRRAGARAGRRVRRALSFLTGLGGGRRCFVAYWEQGGNFGDDYLSQALTRYLGLAHPEMKVVHTGLDLGGQNPRRGDVVIIAGGGLWGPSGTQELDARLYAAWMGLEAPLVLANLGIESFGGRSAEQIRAIAAKAALFSVRDAQSLAYAEEALGAGAVLWGADTTYLSPVEVQRRPVAGRVGVNLCGPEVEDHSRDYSLDLVLEGLRALQAAGHTLHAVAFSHGAAHSDLPHCRRADPDCPPRFSTGPYQQSEFFVGMRFHSVLLALQNEVPVIAVNYSGKVRRLMREYDLEDFCLEPDDPTLPGKLAVLAQAVGAAPVAEKMRAGNERAQARLVPFKDALGRIIGKAGGDK